MTDADKTRMLAVLLKGIPPGTVIYRQLEKFSAAELAALEPVFDEILLRELSSLVKFLIVQSVCRGAP